MDGGGRPRGQYEGSSGWPDSPEPFPCQLLVLEVFSSLCTSCCSQNYGVNWGSLLVGWGFQQHFFKGTRKEVSVPVTENKLPNVLVSQWPTKVFTAFTV